MSQAHEKGHYRELDEGLTVQAVKVQSREQVGKHLAQVKVNIQSLIDSLGTDGSMDEDREMLEALSQVSQEAMEQCPPLSRMASPKPAFTVGLTDEGFWACYEDARAKGLPPKEAVLEVAKALQNSMTPPPQELIR